MPKNTSYSGLLSEIERLQQQAEQVRQQEIKSVIENIHQQMREYNLSPKDLKIDLGMNPDVNTSETKAAEPKGQEQNASNASGKGSKRSGRKVSAKFKDPSTGVTWSGRGRMPKWISDAISQGRTKEEFAI